MTIIAPGADPFMVPTPADYPDDAIYRAGKAPLLDPPQYDWAQDRSPLKMALKCRQLGYSFVETLAQVDECARTPNLTWINLSRGQRQSDELIEKSARHVETINAAIERADGQVFSEKDYYCDSIDERVTMRSIQFKNGSVIRGLPANADTARGFSGHVFLDEFAFHRDARAIKAAVIPITTRGYRLRIVSTPSGKANPYYEMWSDKDSGYVKHRVDIYEAAYRNVHFKPDPAALRRAMADDELFAQEYECVFIDDESAFIPWEMITAAESDKAGESGDPKTPGELYAGLDIGRRRDWTVLWICARQPGGTLLTVAVDVMKGMPFADQVLRVRRWLDTGRVHGLHVDETGMGMPIAEELVTLYGPLVHPVTFTVAAKEQLAVGVKRRLEDRTLLLPVSNTVRSAFRAVRRSPTSGGHFRFDADRSDEHGHIDHVWAAALAVDAANTPKPVFDYQSVLDRPMTRYHRGDEAEVMRRDQYGDADDGPATLGGRAEGY